MPAFHDLTPVLTGNLPILATMYVLLVRGTEGIPPQTAPSGTPPDRETLATSPQRTATESAPPHRPAGTM